MNDIPSLECCWEKIKRANENIDNLDLEISAFIRSRPYELVSDGKRDAYERYIWTVSAVKPVPMRLSVLTGEIVHHLRSSLDLLVYQLIWKETKSRPSFNSEFPVCLSSPGTPESQQSFAGKIKGVSASARTRIESLQPYDSCQSGTKSPLYTVHRLDIIDKHRLLVTVTSELIVTDAIVEGKGTSEAVTVKIGGVYTALKTGAEVYTHINQSHVDMKADLGFEITLNELDVIRYKPVVPTLRELSRFISDTLNSFSVEF